MSRDPRTNIRRRTRSLRRAIVAKDYASSGTLHVRTKVCGRPNCACATDVDSRHGPYYEWTRRVNGKLRHHVVSPAQARLIERALRNYREIGELLARWERETVANILDEEAPDEP
ncbi:MAG: DUF6788 family protein [bacterium]